MAAASRSVDPETSGEARCEPTDPVWRTRLVACAVVLLLFLCVGIFDHELWSPTEPAVAGVVWSMRHQGDFVVPRINGQAYLEKPPLYYWLATLGCEAWGDSSAGLIRLPSALFGLASLGILFLAVRRRYGESVAIATSLLGATTFALLEIFHRACTDAAALFFCCACSALFLRTLGGDEAPSPRRRLVHDLAFALLLAGSFYAKNFFVALIVAPPVGLFLLRRRQYARSVFLAGATLAFLALLLAPWCLALHAAGGGAALRVVFVDNTIGRYINAGWAARLELEPLDDAYTVGRSANVLFYALPLLECMLPWVGIILLGLARAGRARPGDEADSFLRIALFSTLVALTLSASKATEYLLPALFPLLLMAAGVLDDLFRGTLGPLARGVVWGNLWAAAALLLTGPIVLARGYSSAPPPWVFAVAGLVFVPSLLPCAPAARTLRALSATAAASFLLLLAAVPKLDERKSWRPFFDSIRGELAGREIVATSCDDIRMPMISWYLDREVKTFVQDEDVPCLLSSGRRLAVFLDGRFYEQHLEEFRAHTERVIRPAHCPDGWICLLSR